MHILCMAEAGTGSGFLTVTAMLKGWIFTREVRTVRGGLSEDWTYGRSLPYHQLHHRNTPGGEINANAAVLYS
jgi:hypothetical protein